MAVDTTGCLQSLRQEPIPLFAPEKNLCVLWSAKAGCSFATKWFFFQTGRLEQAQTHSAWIHDYRAQVFAAGPAYAEQLAQVLEPGVRVLKFVRNPWDRVVSAYLAYCQALFEGAPRPHDQVIGEVSRFLGRPLTPTAGFTFREFVGYLGDRGVSDCNMHFRRQVSPCELAGRFATLEVVQIETARDALPALERELGLEASPLGDLVRSGHHTVRRAAERFCGDEIFLKTLGASMPQTAAFFDSDLQREVQALYGEDLARYGYPGNI